MSNQNIARRTEAEIAVGGVDITASMRPYVESVTYTDNESDKADDLQIKLHDRDNLWLQQWLAEMIDAAAVSTVGAASSGPTSYRVTPKIGLNVRIGPGTDCRKLGALTCGTVVEVSSIENGWAAIRYQSRTAYVCASYLSPVGETAGTGGAGTVYTAIRGDTLSGIAAQYGTTWRVLADYNGIANPNFILVGQQIKIPSGAGSMDIRASQSSGRIDTLKLQAVIVQKNWTGDGTDKLLDCGQFELDAIDASGPPATVTIKGTSLPYRAQIRQTKKSHAWENMRLSDIAKEMAAANGMICMYESAMDPFYSHVEQIKTSDISFLSVLCRNAGISLKATNSILVLFDQAAYESKAAVFSIRRGSGTYTKYNLHMGTADTQYASCRVSYTPPLGKCIEAVTTVEDYKADAKNNQQLEITARVFSIAEAKALAEKLLRMHNKYAKTATFTLPGNPNLAAGVTVMLEDWGAFAGKYIISQAKHTVGGSGYTTQVKLRKVLEGY